MPRTLDSQLADLRSRSLFRRMREIESARGTSIELVGKQLINFSSNDYLGLADEPALREAAKKAIDEYGVGAGAARLICGTLSPHVRLEQRLAEFKRTEAALSFSSGYTTALGTLGALLTRDDVVMLDKLSHASLIDGARLSGAIVRVFPHNHLGKLESHLKWARDNHPQARVVIATESVFSMDGDCAPLQGIVEIKDRYGAMLMLDEAHAVGVLGDHGRGLADRIGVANRVEIQMGTLSKALGVSGAYVCGSRKLIDLLINRARSFIYSTAPPPALAEASRAAVEFLMSNEGEARCEKLWENLKHLDHELGDSFSRKRPPQSAIIPIIVGNEDTAIAASRWLLNQGFFVPAIRYPTVAKGAARLRITLSASHKSGEISRLCEALKKLSSRLKDAVP